MPWIAVAVTSGREREIAEVIEKFTSVDEIIFSKTEVKVNSDGSTIRRQITPYMGYIFVRCAEWTAELWQEIKKLFFIGVRRILSEIDIDEKTNDVFLNGTISDEEMGGVFRNLAPEIEINPADPDLVEDLENYGDGEIACVDSTNTVQLVIRQGFYSLKRRFFLSLDTLRAFNLLAVVSAVLPTKT